MYIMYMYLYMTVVGYRAVGSVCPWLRVNAMIFIRAFPAHILIDNGRITRQKLLQITKS